MSPSPFLHLPGAVRRAVLLSAAIFVPSLPAQNGNGVRPPPHIGFAYPAGAQRGTTLTVTFGGQNFQGATEVRTTGTGIVARIVEVNLPPTQKEINKLRDDIDALQKKRAAGEQLTPEEMKRGTELRKAMAERNNRRTNPALAESVTLEITVAADAAAGDREIRLRAGSGLSNPVVFNVGTLPEFSTPVELSARPPNQEAPRFARQETVAPTKPLPVTLPAVVNGQVLPGEIDRIRFKARAGQQIVVAVAARALIPYLADAVPGWFQATVALRDAAGHELAYDDDFMFRPDPVLACRIPRDGDYTVEIKDAIYRGRQDFVYRATIGEVPFVTSVFPLGASVGQPVTLSLHGWNLPAEQQVVDPANHPLGTFLLSVRNGSGSSNQVRFALDSTPDCMEDARTTETDTGQPLTTPAIVNGRIDRPGERDVYSFDGVAGASIVAEVDARRLDSPLDSNLMLFGPAGDMIASNDDFEDKAEGLLTHQADSRFTAKLPASGRYRLIVTDTQGRGGADFGYRLHLRPPQPDFAIRVTPSALNLRAGASVPLTVYALRHDGFDGEIKLGLRHPPSGLVLSGTTIPAGVDKVQLTLTALPGLRETVESIELAGLAMIAGRSVGHPAVPAEDEMQAFLYRHLVPARDLTVVVAGRNPSFGWVTKPPVRLKPGQKVRMSVATAMGGALEGFKVELSDPPSGVSVGECSNDRGRLEFDLICDANAAKAGQRGNLIVNIRGERRRGKNAAPAGQNQAMPLGVLPAIPFVIEETKS